MKPAFRTLRAVDRAADERGRKGYGCEADARSGTVRERMMLIVLYRSEYYAYLMAGSPRFSLTGTRVSVCGGRPRRIAADAADAADAAGGGWGTEA